MFVEEGVERGSISEHFSSELSINGFKGKLASRTLGNCFISHQSVDEALVEYKLDSTNIYKFIKELI